jgi:hypothetical protein
MQKRAAAVVVRVAAPLTPVKPQTVVQNVLPAKSIGPIIFLLILLYGS